MQVTSIGAPTAQQMRDAEPDAQRIEQLLNDQGFLGTDRNDHMRTIMALLSSGDTAHVNAVLADLSDADLQKLVSNMDHGGVGGVQGLNNNEQKALFAALASKASPDQYGRLAAAQVHNLLSTQGLAGTDRNGHMRAIAAVLTTGDSAHVTATLARLSDADLNQLAANMDHGGVGGVQGLNDNEQKALFAALASKASPDQYGRLAAAQVHNLLSTQGLAGTDRNGHMRAIAAVLTTGDSAHVTATLARLSDADLNQLAANMDHGGVGGVQGLNDNEQKALFAGLASKASPDQYGRLAAAQVHNLLSTQGLAGTDRNGHMRAIAAVLTTGDSAHVTATLARLSDADLKQLAANMDHGGVGGVQGLNDNEQKALFAALASKASPDQYGRLAAAQVHNLLSTQGLAGTDRNGHMRAIAAVLTTGDSAHVTATLARLSDADLNQLAANMDHGMAGGVQGLNDNEQKALFAALASKASPDQYGRLAAAQVHNLLSTQGLAGTDRNGHMRAIAAVLTTGDSAHVTATLARLSDADLKQLASNMNHYGNHGIQGLSAAERKAFYSQLCQKASPDQLIRFMNATLSEQRAIVLDVFAQQGTPDQLIGLMQALDANVKADPNPKHTPMLNATMLMAAVGNSSSPAVREKFLAAVGQMDQFKGVAQLDQFKAAWGQNQDRRFAIASMLMQDPSLTPQRLAHDQDMAKLSDGAYGRPTVPSYYKAVDFNQPNLDPRLRGLSQADFEDTNSGFSATLYLDTRTNTYVLAYRGSNEWTKDYGQANVPQALGKGSIQYTEAMNLALNLQKRLGSSLTDITGHSLGGGLASAASIVTGIRTTTFDAAGVHPNTVAPYGKTLANGNHVTNYRVRMRS